MQVAPGMTAVSPAARSSAPVVAGVRQPLTPGLAAPVGDDRCEIQPAVTTGQALPIPCIRAGATTAGADLRYLDG